MDCLRLKLKEKNFVLIIFYTVKSLIIPSFYIQEKINIQEKIKHPKNDLKVLLNLFNKFLRNIWEKTISQLQLSKPFKYIWSICFQTYINSVTNKN